MGEVTHVQDERQLQKLGEPLKWDLSSTGFFFKRQKAHLDHKNRPAQEGWVGKESWEGHMYFYLQLFANCRPQTKSIWHPMVFCYVLLKSHRQITDVCRVQTKVSKNTVSQDVCRSNSSKSERETKIDRNVKSSAKSRMFRLEGWGKGPFYFSISIWCPTMLGAALVYCYCYKIIGLL